MLLRIALLLAACYSVNADVYSCPPGWTEFENNCYRYFAFKKSWVQAHLFCGSVAALGYSTLVPPYDLYSELTSIHNSREQGFVQKYWLSSNGDQEAMWIGLHDRDRNRVFRWADGSFSRYQNWNSGEPNNYDNRGEYYVTMLRNGRWNDEHASSVKRFGFICKMRKQQRQDNC